MDPDAAWSGLLAALESGDRDRVLETAAALAGWIDRGGFPMQANIAAAGNKSPSPPRIVGCQEAGAGRLEDILEPLDEGDLQGHDGFPNQPRRSRVRQQNEGADDLANKPSGVHESAGARWSDSPHGHHGLPFTASRHDMQGERG